MTAPFRDWACAEKVNGLSRHNPAKTNGDFRDASRRQDRDNLWRAFGGSTQKETAECISRALGISPRQAVYWLQMEHDMPSWAVKAVQFYLGKVSNLARRIEGE